jgi:hypothetical protein
MRLKVRARAITHVYAHLPMCKHTDIWLPFCGPLQALLFTVLSSGFGSVDASRALFATSRTMAAAAVPVIDLSSLRMPLTFRKRRASYTSAGNSRDDMSISLRDQREAEEWKTLSDNQLVIANAAHPDDADEEHAIHVRKIIAMMPGYSVLRVCARSCLFSGHAPHGSQVS